MVTALTERISSPAVINAWNSPYPLLPVLLYSLPAFRRVIRNADFGFLGAGSKPRTSRAVQDVHRHEGGDTVRLFMRGGGI